MVINPSKIYEQKMLEINNRINDKFKNINNNFRLILENLGSDSEIENYNTTENKTDFDEIISGKSKLYGVNKNLVRAVIKAESNFNPSAVSDAGAIGLMQLMPATAKSLNISNSYDPTQNIDGGIRYLKNQIKNFNGNVKLALAAYNCGPSKLNSLNITDIDDPNQFAKLPKETQNYVNKIMKYINEN